MQARIRLWNNLSGKKEELSPQNSNQVTLYNCGPTVWNYTHVGNARAALTLDLVVRTLRYGGYRPVVARNFTDVDDKIIDQAAKEGVSPEVLAKKYEQAYVHELGILRALPPDHTPRATESIPAMIELIEKLIQKKHAYQKGSDVYFRVLSDPNYGKLSRRKLDDMIAGVRIDKDEEKEHPADFALWKGAKPGEPSWPSPWGEGRPGWHIECSAMIYKLFGESIDIHVGGLDLMFPHHENEIAQSECAHSRPLAKYWIHNGLLELNAEKMSKSLGNIVPTRQFLEDFGPELFRLLIYSVHYRSPLDFSGDNIHRNELLLQRLYTCLLEAEASAEDTLPANLPPELQNLKAKVEECLYDDFNTGKALGLIMSAARIGFREKKPAFWKAWGQCVTPLRELFGILLEEPHHALDDIRKRKLRRTKISEMRATEIEKALIKRTELRAKKEFEQADQLRMDLEKDGILVMDTPEGSTWTVKEN